MKYAGIIALFVLALAIPVRAQNLPIRVDVDHAVFAYDDTSSLLEVYLAIGMKGLQFAGTAGNYTTRLPIVLAATDKASGATVWADTSALALTVPDTAGVDDSRYFVHRVRGAIAPGSYELRIIVPGEGARKQIELRQPIMVSAYGGTNPAISEIIPAASITPSTDRDDPFFRSGLIVRPNPNAVYGDGLPQLYYYAEVYNPPAEGGKYTLRTYVTEAGLSEPTGKLDISLSRPVRQTDVVYGVLPINALPSGTYMLHLDVLKPTGGVAAASVHKFFVYNPAVAESSGAGQNGGLAQFEGLSDAEIDREIKQIQLIAADQERRAARQVKDTAEKRRFLLDFWRKRGGGDDASAMKAYRQFQERILAANERFDARSNTEGWETDRGRVFVQYGQPAHIEPHMHDLGLKPHEIWMYENIPGEGQSIFVFADRNGFGEFELIHSTVRGERSLSDWEVELQR